MSLSKIVVLGPSGGRRFAALADAAKRQGIETVTTINYADMVQRPGGLAQNLTPDTWLRFESPDEDISAFRALYTAGANRAEELGYPVLSGTALEDVLRNPGMLGSPAQIAFGFEALLRQAAEIANEKRAALSNDPTEVMLSYDKTACNTRLVGHGIDVPFALTTPGDFQQLVAALEDIRGGRLFVKLRHGSGASGTIALAAGPRGKIVAYTALEFGRAGVLATKKVRKLTSHVEVLRVFDAVHRLGIHVETWVPKAGIDGRVCDLRVVAIRGVKPFSVLRMSHSPITNLHLDAERGPADLLWQHMSEQAQDDVMATADKVLSAFPNSQMLGIDIAVLNDYSRHKVLEVNAFGDHIRRVTIDGQTPQDAQVIQMQRRMRDGTD